MDNKSASLIRVRPELRKSAAGKNYYVLVTTWNMGNDVPEYNCEVFISAEQYQLISMSKPLDSHAFKQ